MTWLMLIDLAALCVLWLWQPRCCAIGLHPWGPWHDGNDAMLTRTCMAADCDARQARWRE